MDRQRLPVIVEVLGIEAAAAALRGGGAVAFPTPCGYGLAVDPWSSEGLGRLFALKPGRRDPVGLIAASAEQVREHTAAWPALAEDLASRWPAELTLVLPAAADLPNAVVSPLGVAMRVPEMASARALCEAVGRPLTATSLNRSGEPILRRPEDLEPHAALLSGRLAGEAGEAMPSTLVAFIDGEQKVLRQGEEEV